MNTTPAALGIAALAAGGLAACSSGSSDGSAGAGVDADTGTLTVNLMDAPVFDAEEVWICITQVNVKPEEGPPLDFPLDDADGEESSCDGEQFNLLALQDPANAEPLIEGAEVDAGAFDWIELEVDAAMPGQADADGNLDSYVLDSTGGQHVLRVPSASVRLVSGFTVTAGQHTQFTLDWDLRAGLTNPQGQVGYMLRPAFRIIDETMYGTLSGTVTNDLITNAETSAGDPLCATDDADNLDVGNVVYLFAADEGAEAPEPDDTDSVDPNAYATIEVEPNTDDADYAFETIVSPGDYRIAFTCQGDDDLGDRNENDPDNPDDEIDDIVFIDPDGEATITITAGETTTVDFSSLPAT